MFLYLIVLANACSCDIVSSAQAEQAFGNAQVEQIILDRPDIGAIIKHDAALRDLMVASFAGALDKRRVYWDCREPDNGKPSEQIGQYGDYPPLVRVSRSPASSAIDRTVMLVLELQNAYFGRRLEALTRMAQRGQITRNDFARANVHLEFDAGCRTRDYFHEHPLRYAGQEDAYYNSLMTFSADFGDYIKWLESKDDDNLFRHYQHEYDEMHTLGKADTPAISDSLLNR